MKIFVFMLAVFVCNAPSARAQATRAADRKVWLALAVAGEGASVADAVLTKQGLRYRPVTCTHGALGGEICNTIVRYEADPLAKPFVQLPSPAYYSFAVGASAATSFLALKMKRSRHHWIRSIWWLPQVTQIAANSWGISTWVGMDAPRSHIGGIPWHR